MQQVSPPWMRPDGGDLLIPETLRMELVVLENNRGLLTFLPRGPPPAGFGSGPERFCWEQRKIVKFSPPPPPAAGLPRREGPAGGDLLVPKPLRNGIGCCLGQTGGEDKSDGII